MQKRGGMSRSRVALLPPALVTPSPCVPLIPANAACVEVTHAHLRLMRPIEDEQHMLHVFTHQVATPGCLQAHRLGCTIVVSCHSLAQLSRSRPVWDRLASWTFSALSRARL